MDPDFLGALNTVLAAQVPGFMTLTDCQQLTAGASQETYRLQLDSESGEQQYALRRCPPTLQDDSSVGQIDLATEAKLIQLAGHARIPVPEVLYVLQPQDGLGDGFLMQWLDGETLGQRIVKLPSLANTRPKLARQCGEVLARLHAVKLEGELVDQLPTVTPASLVRETWDWYRALDIPAPMIDFTARWLLENLPTQSRQTLVHGDFRNGNLMIDESGICAVLDWELAQIGDPIRDLGWLCVNSWRFGVAELPVGGFGTVADLLSGYRAESGIEVSDNELLFWQVFGSFWWSAATLNMAATWRTGETPSLERPVIGRRSSEAQMDCVNLLIPGDFELPTATALDDGTQLPMPAELLEGVRTFLQKDIAALDDRRSAFLARVAANSLGIAQREMLCGPALANAEHARLEALLGAGSLDQLRHKLVTELRAELPLHIDGLAEHLRQTVAGQLSIDQPGYSALRME